MSVSSLTAIQVRKLTNTGESGKWRPTPVKVEDHVRVSPSFAVGVPGGDGHEGYGKSFEEEKEPY